MQKLQNAHKVVSKIAMTPGSSAFNSRTNDTYITTKMKSVLADAEGVSWNSIKVITKA